VISLLLVSPACVHDLTEGRTLAVIGAVRNPPLSFPSYISLPFWQVASRQNYYILLQGCRSSCFCVFPFFSFSLDDTHSSEGNRLSVRCLFFAFARCPCRQSLLCFFPHGRFPSKMPFLNFLRMSFLCQIFFPQAPPPQNLPSFRLRRFKLMLWDLVFLPQDSLFLLVLFRGRLCGLS